ncbi:hypothetical protein [Runella zeae]|uniref:hypothetical protein n=1 Tax=Runella zeae TaxID=94255 RepID=UPI0023539930|nr:hypothetical protein [Runella zeae]
MRNHNWDHFKSISEENIDNSYLIEETQLDLDTTLKLLSKEDVEKFLWAKEEFFNYEFLTLKIDELFGNLKEFLDTFFHYSISLNHSHYDGNPPLKDLSHELFITINRKFTNFLMSLSNFYDVFKRRITKKYGKNSLQLQSFTDFDDNLKKSSFAYSLFRDLRNYAAHVHFPINNTQVSEYWDDKSEKYLLEIFIYLNKEELLSDRFIQQNYENKLTSYNKLFPLEPFINEIQYPINNLISHIFRIYEPELKQNVDVFERLLDMRMNQNNQIFIGKVKYVDKNGQATLSKQTVPFELMQKFKKDLQKYSSNITPTPTVPK